ncbi:MAG: ABC transporter ATP-binding protein [Sphingobacteriaceae bacterium]|nr:ABC transporter ATP-binding protein [Sphingobacteriaceae bacterium]
MNKDIAIKVENLSKVYKLYNAPIDRMKEALHPRKKSYHKEFYALNDLNFEIKKGQTVGIIGKNGSGKSTLLKIITGVLTPTTGKVTVNGRISALLELGAGFNPEYTGMENIYFQGNLMGFERAEMEAKVQEILDFADIGDFIHQPVKNYSSGMFARLAFAVAINVEPEVLIVDEALSVGDMAFQAKCGLRMQQLKDIGTTILFVSHSIATIRALCSKALYLNAGNKVDFGDVKKVCQKYENDINQSFSGIAKNIQLLDCDNMSVMSTDLNYDVNPFFSKNCDKFRNGTGEAVILNVDIFADGVLTNDLQLNCKVKIRIYVHFKQDVLTEGTIGYMIQSLQGVNIFGYNIYNSGSLIPPMKSGQTIVIDFNFINPLAPGEYTVSVGVKSIPLHPTYLDQVLLSADIVVSPLKDNFVAGVVHINNHYNYKIL